ncbi:hypothetical protein AB0903_29770 [Streptomyces sp. NPDC048389]|uniref:hypothetical protein n=1 Tax=Streptomyces sp. NPDC048389 TaxID=3154622 RepID=UPI003451710C
MAVEEPDRRLASKAHGLDVVSGGEGRLGLRDEVLDLLLLSGLIRAATIPTSVSCWMRSLLPWRGSRLDVRLSLTASAAVLAAWMAASP